MRRLLPGWVGQYRGEHLAGDLVAGLVAAMLLVPQGLAYAALAGLPPQLGLYASILPLLAYAALGSSMVLAVGPVAVISLMTASALTPIATPGSPEYIAAAGLLALLSGLMLLAFGLLRLGALARYLSHPVISGFVSGAAIVILIGQLRPLLGIRAEGELPWQIALDLVGRITEIHWPTAASGLTALALLLLARFRLPGLLARLGLQQRPAATLARLAPMVVVLGAALLVPVLGWERQLAVVGEIPAGLPDFVVPGFDLPLAAQLLLPALLISIIGFMESASIAQSYASRRRQPLDHNAELRGLGAANLASAVSGAFPVTGGFARTVVNAEAGARTPLAGVLTAGLIALVVSFAADLFRALPHSVLAAVIIAAVASLIDVATLRRVWAYDRLEGTTLVGTALAVLAFGVEIGIACGILLSLAALVWRASHPHMAVIGRVAGTEHFRNVERHAVETDAARLLVRIDENLFFGNADAVRARIATELRRRPGTRDLILVMSSVSRIDATALEMLEELDHALVEQGIRLHLAEVKGPVLDGLAGTAFLRNLSGGVHLSTHIACEATSRPA